MDDPPRATKRRKMAGGDTPKYAASAVPQPPPPPPSSSANQPSATRSAQEIWQEAKMKSRAGRQKPKEKKVQDAQSNTGAPAGLSRARSMTNGSQTAAAPAKAVANVGFFKQFQKPKNDDTADTAAAGRSSGRSRRTPVKVNGSANGAAASPSIAAAGTFEDAVVASTQEKAHPRTTKIADRRKSNGVDPMEIHTEPDPMDEDVMEIDDSDAEDIPQSPTNNISLSKPQNRQIIKPKPTLPECSFTAKNIQLFQSVLLKKLTGMQPIPLTNLVAEYAKVETVIGQSITAGESNSMLLIGARGSGKTALVDKILRDHKAKHADDFLVVRLNGFIHTDDKIALREIWRQLGREMALDEAENAARNYADTLTTLLALLSHPTELGAEQDPDQITKSVIFILDEFDLFATHPRQTLLYNLFDIAQSRKAPIAVLGLTTRVDVAESLEKRVKSRFSHRYVHLSLAKSFQAFQETCMAILDIKEDELSPDGPKTSQETLANWTAVIDTLLSSEKFMTLLQRLYYTSKSVPDFMSSILAPIACLPTKNPMTPTELMEYFSENWQLSSVHPPDSKLSLLGSLSSLQLALLISAARLVAIHDSDAVSFALAYEEYKLLASKAKLQASASGALAQGAGSRISSKDVARDSWARLMDCGLIMDDSRGGGRVDVGLEEIGGSGIELGQWGRWCREI